jgi:hypothetical protein
MNTQELLRNAECKCAEEWPDEVEIGEVCDNEDQHPNHDICLNCLHSNKCHLAKKYAKKYEGRKQLQIKLAATEIAAQVGKGME